jgi:hypothetical protein
MWRQYAPLKRQSTSTWLHGGTSHKTPNLILATVRTWNLTWTRRTFSNVIEIYKIYSNYTCLPFHLFKVNKYPYYFRMISAIRFTPYFGELFLPAELLIFLVSLDSREVSIWVTIAKNRRYFKVTMLFWRNSCTCPGMCLTFQTENKNETQNSLLLRETDLRREYRIRYKDISYRIWCRGWKGTIPNLDASNVG